MTSNERTTERSYYARKRRIDLVRELAPEGKCDECGCVFDHEHLTVDHRDGRPDWIVSEVSPSVRSARYWAEYKAGVPLRALCGQCNSVDGGSRRYFGAR